MSFSDQLLMDIVGQHPALAVLLEEWGIDSVRCGGLTLAAVCAAQQLDLVELCRLLELAHRANPQGLAGLSRTQLVNHVRGVHHDYLRRHLPGLQEVASLAARLYGSQYQHLRHVEQIVQVLAQELAEQVAREEQFAFPWLGSEEVGAVDRWMLDSLAEERRKSSFRLNCLRFLTNFYAPPSGAGESICRLYTELRNLDRDFQRHVYVEDRYLFPRQLAA
ncbi:hemerythrin domain-containing protein [bacterium]|nr:hemerythrin domain-containing protein [bacterium]